MFVTGGFAFSALTGFRYSCSRFDERLFLLADPTRCIYIYIYDPIPILIQNHPSFGCNIDDRDGDNGDGIPSMIGAQLLAGDVTYAMGGLSKRMLFEMVY